MLLSVVEAPYRGPRSRPSGGSVSEEKRIFRPQRILVAEDNPVNQRLALRILEKSGHTVEIVSNGRQAVDRVAAERFDVVLMDVQMPEMDGVEATATIRKREQASGEHVPIIALTAHAMSGDREFCLSAGMDAYVTKPINAAELLHAIDALGGGDSMLPPPTTTQLARMAVFDSALVLSQVEGDIVTVCEIIDLFLESVPTGSRSAGPLQRRTDGGWNEPDMHSKALLETSAPTLFSIVPLNSKPWASISISKERHDSSPV